MFDYPLTLTEIQRYCYGAKGEVALLAIQQAITEAGIRAQNGYYFLKGREEIVATRQRRYRLAEKRFQRATKVARFMKRMPSVRYIAVCNSLAISNADIDSDIDLFVVVRPGYLWATRFIVVSVLSVLGLRPKGEMHADKVCLSFFVSEEAMNLSGLALEGGDTYLKYWLATLEPLYDAGEVHEKLMKQNEWILDSLPHISTKRLLSARCIAPAPKWLDVFLPIYKSLEKPLKKIQQQRFPKSMKAMMNFDSRVVVSDSMLKFHTTDRRAEYEEIFSERLRAYNIDHV